MENEYEMKFVTDEYKTRHEVRGELSRGGQGIIYKTGDPEVVIKLDLQSEADTSNREAIMEYVRRRYQNIRLLPIPIDFPIAKPLAVLESLPGYVMEFLNGMEPIQNFIDVGALSAERVGPEWIKVLPDERLKQLLYHYLDTGGLMRRMAVLARCAEILAMLHLRGILYGDISPANIFMSGMGTKQRNVWLIDTDNLCLASQTNGGAVYTPSYGAPEVILGNSGNSFYTDQYAFALMAFQVLAMKSPFQGALLEDQAEEWDCDGVCAAERATRGELPWIEDDEDDSNLDSPEGRALRGELIYDELRQLFHQTFGRLGRTNPSYRPTMLRWAVTLYKSMDRLVHCANCGMDYYGAEEPETECPYCEYRQTSEYTLLRLSTSGAVEWVYRSNIPKEEEKKGRYRLSQPKGIDVPARVFRLFILDKSAESFLKIYRSFDKKKVVIEKNRHVSDALLWSDEQSEKSFRELSARLRFDMAREDRTIFFKLDKTSSVVKCIIKGQDTL